MYLEAIRTCISIHRVQAVPLREEILERAGPWLVRAAIRLVRTDELRGLSEPAAAVVNGFGASRAAHFRPVIGKVQPQPRHPHREPAGGVEAEEQNAGFTLRTNIGSYVQLGKCRD